MVVTVCAGACPPLTPVSTPKPPRAAAVATAVRERERRCCPRGPVTQAGATRPTAPMKSGRRAGAAEGAAETRRLRRPLLLPARIMVEQAARDASRRRRVVALLAWRRTRMQQVTGPVGSRDGALGACWAVLGLCGVVGWDARSAAGTTAHDDAVGERLLVD